MLSLLLDYILKGNKLRDILVRGSFFTLNGILASILLNDIIRVLYGDFHQKRELEYGLAWAIAVSPYLIPQFTLFGHTTNNLAMGLGMGLGTFMANRSEHGHRLELF
jgi:hypothetical protein